MLIASRARYFTRVTEHVKQKLAWYQSTVEVRIIFPPDLANYLAANRAEAIIVK